MVTVREVMRDDVEYLRTSETAADAASFLACHEVGAIPLCQPDGSLAGVVTDRDIVVKVVAQGKDPRAFPLSALVETSEAHAVGPDDPVEEVAAIMARYQVRRLPVTDNDRIIGLVTHADVARSLSLGHAWGDL
ncbi:MAG: CBS domain-containing protein [Acidimicrobiales bacterium]